MSTKPRSINIFLLDGDPEGIRVAQIALSTIQAIAFRRNQLKTAKEAFPEISRPGVYLLLGTDIKDTDKRLGYIGESEDVASRLQKHFSDSEKEFWSETVALVSKDENLTKSHARYVEAKLMELGQQNKQWTLTNQQPSNAGGKLPVPDRAAMDEFIEQAKTLVGALGCDLFKLRMGKLTGISTAKNPQMQKSVKDVVFSYEGTGYSANAELSGNGELIVRAGSTARLEAANSMPKGALKLREKLLTEGVLEPTPQGYRFKLDYVFDSPSAAAAIISGTSVNGRIMWKLPNGMTYADWENAENDVGTTAENPQAVLDITPNNAIPSTPES